MTRLSAEIRTLLAADDAGRLRQPLHGHVRRILAEALLELEAPAIDAAHLAAQLVVARAIAWKHAYDCRGRVDEEIATHQLIETIEALPERILAR